MAKTIAENLAIACEVTKEIPDRDIYHISVGNDEIRVHLCFRAFQRIFGGCECELSNGVISKLHGTVTYSAMMQRQQLHGVIACPREEVVTV